MAGKHIKCFTGVQIKVKLFQDPGPEEDLTGVVTMALHDVLRDKNSIVPAGLNLPVHYHVLG